GGRAAPGRPGARRPRGGGGPALGRADLRRDRAAPGVLPERRAPAVPGRAGPIAREARATMDTSGRAPQGDLNDLERRLAGWRPAASGLDRDRLMFEAGRASARPGRRERIGSVSLACLALVLGVLLAQERAQRRAGTAGPVTTAPSPSPAVSPASSSPALAPDPDSYL